MKIMYFQFIHQIEMNANPNGDFCDYDYQRIALNNLIIKPES